MDRANLSQRLNFGESAHWIEVEEIVEGLIAKRGYHSVIYDLLVSVNNLAEISLADPQSTTKVLAFGIWARTVKAAILRHSQESTFEHSVSDSDLRWAQRLGITLK